MAEITTLATGTAGGLAVVVAGMLLRYIANGRNHKKPQEMGDEWARGEIRVLKAQQYQTDKVQADQWIAINEIRQTLGEIMKGIGRVEGELKGMRGVK